MNWFFWRKKQKTITDEVVECIKELFSDVKPEIMLAIGPPLAFYMVKKITKLVEEEKKENWFLRIINKIKYDFFRSKF